AIERGHALAELVAMLVAELELGDGLLFRVGADARRGSLERRAQLGGQRAPRTGAAFAADLELTHRPSGVAVEALGVLEQGGVPAPAHVLDDLRDRGRHLWIGFGRAVEQLREGGLEAGVARVQAPELQRR